MSRRCSTALGFVSDSQQIRWNQIEIRGLLKLLLLWFSDTARVLAISWYFVEKCSCSFVAMDPAPCLALHLE